MTVNFNSNVGYVPSKSYSNVNFAQRNENMEAPKKSNTKKYVAAGVGLAAIAAAIVFRKPIGQAAKNLLGKIKLFDFSSMAKKVGIGARNIANKAKVKAGEIFASAKTVAKDLVSNIKGKIKMPDFSSMAKKVGIGARNIANKAKVKAGEFYNTAKTTVKDALGKITAKFTSPMSSISASTITDKFKNIWQGAKNYAVKGWEFAKQYGQKAIEWVKNIFHKLFHKPVTPTAP